MLSGAGTPLNDILAGMLKGSLGPSAASPANNAASTAAQAAPVQPSAPGSQPEGEGDAGNRDSSSGHATGPGGLAAVQAENDYRVTAQTFRKMLAEFEKNFTDRDRVPLNLYNTIRKMIEDATAAGADKQPGRIDHEA